MIRIVTPLFLMIVFSFVSGCCRRIYPVTETRDSIWVHDTTVFRDTIIKTPASHVSIDVDPSEWIGVVSHEPVSSTNNNATVTVRKNKNGTLTANCDCDTLAIEAKIKDSYHQQVSVRMVKQTVVQEVKYIPWWTKLLSWSGGIGIVVLGVFLFFKLRK